QLHSGSDVVRFGLLQILFRRAADFGERALTIAALQRQRQQHLGTIVIRIGGREVGGVDDKERLTGLHPLAKLNLKLHHATSKRWQHLDQVGGIGLHDRWKN